ncbi:ITGAV family protein [Megaselia abdita]
MTMGDFDGDGEEDVAVGMPRGSQLMGRIVINKWNMENLVNITGWQLGAYFGYSIAAVDVDGDKLTDLVVGAPLYTEPNNEGRYEVGRVYILLQTRQRSFKPEIFRDGFGNRGRFGLSLASLGDINLDGYGDFAVGAPYDGPQGRGAVYIYHGSSTGPLKKPSQIIYAEDLVGTTIPKTFGFSLSGGVDMDDNAYPDMAVGAYDSDSVFVFKSRPVAIIDASTQFTSASKLISLDEKRCTRRFGKLVPCTDVESCIRYDGKNLPPILDFEVSWVLDSKKTRNPRMFFLRDDNNNNIRNSTYRLERGKRFCVNETVYLVDDIRDKLTPLEVEMRYQLRGSRNKVTTRRKRELLEPVIDQNREIIQRDSLNIQKNCGSDNICIPDLRLSIETVDKFLLGSREPLSIKVLITNNGEDAFEAGFYLTIPENLYYRRFEPISNIKDVPITCSGPSATSNNTVKCDLGNPFPANQVAEFKVVFIPTHKSGMSPSYDFYMEANSTNAELESKTYDNKITKSIGIWIETEIQIEGNSFPSEDYYNAAEFKTLEAAKNESELGPHIVHLYNIRNNGTSIIDEAVVFIHYPYRTEGNDTLLYLLNQPETSRNIQCEKTIQANPYNLALDRNLQRSYNLVNLTGTAKSSSSYQTHVELSQSPSATSAVSRTKILTAEERKKLSEEENQESEGDASYIHNQRANDASVLHTASFGSGGPPAAVVYKNQMNRTTYYDDNGTPHVVESSTEFYNPRGYNVQYGQRTSGSGGQSSGSSGQSYGSSGQQQTVYGGQNRYDDKGIGAGQTGFRAGVLDLGTGSRTSADEELHKQASSGRYQQSQDYRPGSHYQHSSTWSSGDPGMQTEYHDFQDNNNHYEYANNRQFQHQDANNRQYQTQQDHQSYQRGKREVLEHKTFCKAAKCETLRCVVSNLENDNNDGSYILIRMRLVAKTAEKIAPKTPLKLSTMAVSHITRLPYIGAPKDDKVQSHEIFFVANPTPEQVPDVVPLWVVVLAACAGALILLLLAFLLYKCGFFNRNRPTDHSQERQPLNSRNGYH